MLKDRRVLLEQEIARVFDEAAAKYLDIVVNDGDVHSAEYQSLSEKVMKLQFDLDIVNKLIRKAIHEIPHCKNVVS